MSLKIANTGLAQTNSSPYKLEGRFKGYGRDYSGEVPMIVDHSRLLLVKKYLPQRMVVVIVAVVEVITAAVHPKIISSM